MLADESKDFFFFKTKYFRLKDVLYLPELEIVFGFDNDGTMAWTSHSLLLPKFSDPVDKIDEMEMFDDIVKARSSLRQGLSCLSTN